MVLAAPSVAATLADSDYSVNNVFSHLAWLTLPILLSGLMLPVRETVLVALAGLLAVVGLALLIPDLSLMAVSLPLGFMATMSSMIVLGTAIRNRQQARIGGQLEERAATVDALREIEGAARGLLDSLVEVGILSEVGGPTVDGDHESEDIVDGLRVLAVEFTVQQRLLEHTERRLNELMDVIVNIANLDFSQRARVGEAGDIFDAIGTGLNVLTEEMRASTVSRDYLDSVIQAMMDTLIVTDAQGNITTANQATLNLLGYRINELVGEPVASIFVSGDFDDGQLPLGKAEQVYLSKAGLPIPVSWSGSPLIDGRGNVLGAVCVARDISERKRIEAAERQQRTLAEALHDTATALNSTLKLDEVLDRILANVGRVVPYESANIMLIEDEVSTVVRSRNFSVDSRYPTISGLQFDFADFPSMQHMAATGQSVVVGDTQYWEEWPDTPELQWIRSFVVVPIGRLGEISGILVINSKLAGFFTALHAERLQVFADQAAIAIENARLYEQAQELAALEERQRLARDLHDAVSQTLFSASVIAQMLPRFWESDREQAELSLDQLRRLTRGALAEMRTLLLELRPTSLTESSLGELLRQLAEGLAGRLGIDVGLKLEGEEIMPVEAKINLYRIAQEATNNIAKHARAEQVTVSMQASQDELTLRVTDDGRGFDSSQPAEGRLGLDIMRERAAAIGAHFEVSGMQDQGTEITVIWQAEKAITSGAEE